MDTILTTELGVKKRFVKPKKILYVFYIDVKYFLLKDMNQRTHKFVANPKSRAFYNRKVCGLLAMKVDEPLRIRNGGSLFLPLKYFALSFQRDGNIIV